MEKGKRVVKPGQLERRENRVGYLFILPWLIGFLALVAWPMIQSFQYSLNKIKLLPQGMAKLYVGFENYSQIFLTDPDFIMGTGDISDRNSDSSSGHCSICIDHCDVVK